MTESYDDRHYTSGGATRYIKKKVSDADIAPVLDSDDKSSKSPLALKPSFWTSLVAGGLAGIVVDCSLYPLDTLKTRHQSKDGFWASGGFRKIYKGIIPVLLCSAPISALFFCTYNSLINALKSENSHMDPYVYLIAASVAETICASVRVPLDVVKQRKQVSSSSAFYIMQKTMEREGLLGFYRGFSSTIVREIPFACIQYPLWEYMITQNKLYRKVQELDAFQIACCGSAAGAFAAVLTTPLDVIKTRIMLADREKILYYKPFVNYSFAREIFYENGITGFFAGVIPRMLWMMFGGFIYFGAYEKAKVLVQNCFTSKSSEKDAAEKVSLEITEKETVDTGSKDIEETEEEIKKKKVTDVIEDL